MPDNITVVLVRPRFPENIGSVARAMANFGGSRLILVEPRNLDLDKARKTATVHAAHLVDTGAIVPDLATALAECHAAYGTTARTGGWRQAMVAPRRAAEEIRQRRSQGQGVALVFGPEDRGLENAEVALCTRLVHIPTAPELSSLNLAQAALLMLYECHAATLPQPGPVPEAVPADAGESGPGISMAEQQALFGAMQQALTAIDVLKQPNPDYWMLPLRRFFAKVRLRRGEFNLLMGICRQVNWLGTRLRQLEGHVPGPELRQEPPEGR